MNWEYDDVILTFNGNFNVLLYWWLKSVIIMDSMDYGCHLSWIMDPIATSVLILFKIQRDEKNNLLNNLINISWLWLIKSKFKDVVNGSWISDSRFQESVGQDVKVNKR
jgi:hypothetical protein